MHIDPNTLPLIKYLAVHRSTHFECHRAILTHIRLKGYETLYLMPASDVTHLRYECLSDAGYYWLVDYYLPLDWVDRSWEFIEKIPTWSGGDRVAFDIYRVRLYFVYNDKTVFLQRDILEHIATTSSIGKKSFMGGWIE